MRLTLDIPDALADQIRSAAAAEGSDVNHYAVAQLQQVFASLHEQTEVEEVDPDLLSALREGIDQADAGQLLTREQVDEGVYAALAARHQKSAA
jgi:predicted transcriptional regulator